MKHTYSLLAALVLLSGVAFAQTAFAYVTPEDVLLNKNLYLPPSARESADRTARQAQESAERRSREQEILFKSQQPEEASSSSVSSHAAAADTSTLSEEDLKLLQTVRLLDRVQKNQQVLQYGGRVLLPNGMLDYHGGAPLTPSGPGGVAAAITMVGSVAWTMWRAKRVRALARG